MTIYRNIFIFFFSIFVNHAVFASELSPQSMSLNGTPDISKWGLDFGFGNQVYMETVPKIGLVTPHLFGNPAIGGWRAALDFSGKNIVGSSFDGIMDISLSLESDGLVYKDIVYSYVKFGIGTLLMDDDLYDGNVLTLPISLGFQLIAANSPYGIMSYFMEYRFIALSDFKEDKGFPSQANNGLDKDIIFGGTLSFGVRYLF